MADSKETDIEDITDNNRFIRLKRNKLIPEDKREILNNFMMKLYSLSPEDESDYRQAMMQIRRELKIQPKKAQLSYLYRVAVQNGAIVKNKTLETLLITKKMRSGSGVLVVAVIMGPGKFSCAFNCYFCPKYPNISRSYIPHEPTVERGRKIIFQQVYK